MAVGESSMTVGEWGMAAADIVCSSIADRVRKITPKRGR